MTRITIDLNALRTLLSTSVPFADAGRLSLPVINSVYLAGRGKWLTATATDRYVMGMTRAEVAGVDGFEALLKLADVKHILRTFTAAKGQGRAVTVGLSIAAGKLTVDREDGLFADCDSLTATYALIDGTFPGVRKVLRDWKAATVAAPNGYNPTYLARFQHVGRYRGEPVKFSIGDDKGITLIQAGDYFIGAIMPVRLADDRSGVVDLSEWGDVLGEPAAEKAAPVKKAAAKKAPARKRAAAKVA